MNALIELHYLPSIWVMAYLCHPTDHLTLEMQEHYQKRSFRNRCHINGPKGAQVLSIPLQKGKHQQLPIKEVRIANDTPWERTHLRTIQSAYGNAPFFEHYMDNLSPLYNLKQQFLWDWNIQFFEWLRKQLRVEGITTLTTTYQPHASEDCLDLRQRLQPTTTFPDHLAAPSLPYPQAFNDRHPFLPGLSGLDLLFCAGPSALSILRTMRAGSTV